VTGRLTAADITDLGLTDWRVLRREVEANFEAHSYAAAGQFVADVAALCDELDHHAAVDLRYPGLVHVVSTTHWLDALTDRDVALARAVSALAAEQGLKSTPRDSMQLEVAIDAVDIDSVVPFWRTVLGYVPEHAAEGAPVRGLIDPEGIEPSVFFRHTTQVRPQPGAERNHMHLDVHVPHDVAEERVAAALAAGGRLVSEKAAPSCWVLADAEGNEACLCTWQDRA
jgi:4a-hydroxytetrahydrobiopterin dehydratase